MAPSRRTFRQQLMDELWGYARIRHHTVDVHIAGPERSGTARIQNRHIRGVGYKVVKLMKTKRNRRPLGPRGV